MSRDSHAFGTTILWKTQIIFLKMKCDDAQSLRENIRDMVKILLRSTKQENVLQNTRSSVNFQKTIRIIYHEKRNIIQISIGLEKDYFKSRD